MLATVVAAAVVCAASVVVGQALLAAAGWREWSPLAAGVGFGALLVICGLGGRVLALLVAVAGAAVWLVAAGRVGGRDPGRRELFPPLGNSSRTWLAAGLIAAVAAAIPFVVNDRVGVLGAGLVNDDMANHLLMADWAQNGTEPRPELIDDGYPLGPHSLAATLSDLLGTGLVEAFAGMTLAIAALAAITAIAALDRLPTVPRTFAAALAALPYLGAAYLVQGAFKEPIQALLLITFALLLARHVEKFADSARSSTSLALIPVGVVAAAAIYNYSFPGLFWLASAAGVFFVLVPRPFDAVRALARPAAIATGIALFLTAPEWTRIIDFTGFGAFDPAGEQTGLGNLRQAISPLEALGVWPTGEYRLAPADASIPAIAFYLGGLLGAIAVGLGIAVAVKRRREDVGGIAVVAALGAAAVIYAGAAVAGTPYTSAKALAIAAVPAMLVSLRALLSRGALSELMPRVTHHLARGTGALAAAFVLAAAGSTFLAVRQAPVSPAAHADELAEIRGLVAGDAVLFLGRDDFIAWHLRGAPVSTHIQNFFSTGRVAARVDPTDGEKFDFDAVSAATLDRFDWVLTSSTAYASQPPASFEEVARTPSYALWRRTGATKPREILAEGAAPGAIGACSPTRRADAAAVWPTAPTAGGEADWRPSATIAPGETTSQPLRLPRGIVELSLAYDSPRPLELRVRGSGLRPASLRLPANLDFRGPTPPFPATPELEVHEAGRYEIAVTLAEAPLAGRILGAEGEAHLRGVFAVETGSPPVRRERIALCDRYVDWYFGGRRRSPGPGTR